MELMLQPLVKYADFEGRARRSEYWLFTLFLWIIAVVFFVVVGSGGAANPRGAGTLMLTLAMLLCLFGVVIPSIAVTVRRLHDIDRSGLWFLIGFVPIAGPVVIFIFSVMDGTRGPNRFGADPKARTPYMVPPTVTEVHHYHHGAPPAPPSAG